MSNQQISDLGAAGVPQDAIKRLSELQPGKAGSIFTSDLSVNEFLLVREVGLQAARAGARLVDLPRRACRSAAGARTRSSTCCPRRCTTRASWPCPGWRPRRTRSAPTASSGVRLDVEMKEFGADIAEFIAVGTAVKAEPGAGGGGVSNWRNNKKQPFTSDLSGQDFWTLIRAGYAPLGMVMGSCVYHVAHQRMGSVLGNIGRNVEIEQFTQALYDARELAMTRMQAEAEELHAEGIVGVQLRQHSPHLGLAHHRVLRDRHRGTPAARRPRHRAARPWCSRWTPEPPADFTRSARPPCRAGGPAGTAGRRDRRRAPVPRLARRGRHQVLARVEGQRRRDGQGLVGEPVQLRVVAVQGEDGGAGLARVADPLEQRHRRGVLAPPRTASRPAGPPPAGPGRPTGAAAPPAAATSAPASGDSSAAPDSRDSSSRCAVMCHGSKLGRADHQQPARRPRRRPQRPAEQPGPLQPAASRT